LLPWFVAAVVADPVDGPSWSSLTYVGEDASCYPDPLKDQAMVDTAAIFRGR
jgi:hypothetical protein